MGWTLLAQIVLKLLFAVLQAWFEDVFKRAAQSLDKEPSEYAGPYNHDAIEAEKILWHKASDILAEDASQVWSINIFGQLRNIKRRRFFEAARQVAVTRSGQFYMAAYGGSMAPEALTAQEQAQLRQTQCS
jgi:hypothetical protein